MHIVHKTHSLNTKLNLTSLKIVSLNFSINESIYNKLLDVYKFSCKEPIDFLLMQGICIHLIILVLRKYPSYLREI